MTVRMRRSRSALAQPAAKEPMAIDAVRILLNNVLYSITLWDPAEPRACKACEYAKMILPHRRLFNVWRMSHELLGRVMLAWGGRGRFVRIKV